MDTGSTLRVSAELENLSEIRGFVEQAATALGAGEAAITDVLLAVDEAATNIILHGYRGRPGDIEIEVKRREGWLVINLRDQARTFDPTRAPSPDLTLPLEQRPLGGLGIYLMRQIMDEISYCTLPQGGNELKLVKKIE